MQQTPLPLHPAQHDVLTDQLINPKSPHYNLGGYIVLRGELDKQKFVETIHSGAAVFDAFSMRFDAEGSRFEGYYDDEYTSMEIDEVDFSHLTPEEVIAWMQNRFNTAFEIHKNKQLFEQFLIKIRGDEHWFFGRYHHLITDGYGFIVWVNYIARKYKSLVEGDEVEFAYPSYREAAAASFDYKNSSAYAAEGEYWKERIPGKPQRLLQKKYPDATKSSTFHLDLNAEQWLLIDNLQASTSVSIQQLTIAALLIYFGKVSGQSDFLFGIPVHKRGSRNLRNIVGMFSGILPLIASYEPATILLDLLKNIAASQKRDYRNHNYLNGDLTRTLKIPATEGYLCEVLINYELLHFQLDFGTAIDASITRLANEADLNPLQIIWCDYAVHKALQLQIHYSTAFFTGQEIEWLARRIIFILQQFSQGLHLPIGSFEILPPPEYQLISGFIGTQAAYPRDLTLVDLFEEQVRKTPEKAAVVYQNQQLSYQDLNVQANRFAHYLQSRGAKSDMLIPICMERSIEMIVGILGILKAGSAYVPVEPEYPSERIEYILNDTQATIVVCNRQSRLLLNQSDKFEIVETGIAFGFNSEMPEDNLLTRPSANSLAYVIYTSGSTGRPKGAMNEHNGLVNRLLWAKDYFTVTDEDSVLQKTTFSFDVSVWELFLPLLCGARLVFATSKGHKDNDYLKEIIEKEKITIIHFVPSMLGNFLPDIQTGTCSNLKKILCSGEVLKPWHVNLFREKFPAGELHNLYGPTEAAIDVTCWTVPNNNDQIKIVPIGKAIANTAIYILNKEQQVVPIGTTGEIYIGGIQVGRGYLNLPDLTKEKFVSDPFSKETGARLYKTGDLGSWLTDGTIEYVGRTDNQVKIRGYRIEPGEIESVLEQSGLVKMAVVLAKEDGNRNKRLVGYVVANESFDKKKVIAFLKNKLPEYMVPALWVQLQTLPLTPNGKIDRKALPDADLSEQVNHLYIAPATKTEADLVAVWQELLSMKRIGTADNFFELGGDSIIAIQIVSRLKQLGYFLQPKDIFIHQTIGNVSINLKGDSGTVITAEQGLLTGTAALLPIQQWYFEKDQPAISHYNQSVLLKIEKSITLLLVQQAITELSRHHDALRFTYHQTNGIWQQEYGSDKPEISNEDLRSVPDQLLNAAISEHAGTYHRRLNIEKGEIIRAVWMQTPAAEKNNRLLIVIHHLAVDVVSWRILLEDLQYILNALISGGGISLGRKGSSYRQWYAALENYGQSKRLLSQQKFWEEVTKNYSPLAVDQETVQEVRIKDTGLVTIKLNATQTTRLLQQVPHAYHTEINDILLAALIRTLCDWNSKDKVVIGLEGHGRESVSSESIDISRTVGWFTSLYPVVLEAAGAGKDNGELMIGIKEQLRRVPDRGLGYGVLKYITKEATLQGAQAWDIVFNYLGQLDNVAKEGTWLSVSDETAGAAVSGQQVVQEKLAIDSYIQTGELVFTWKYSSLHYRVETIKAITRNYLSHLELLISHCVEKAENEPVFTPSDYGFGAEISYPELHAFLEEAYNGKKRKDAIEAIYRLSSLQQGMLFHGLYDGGREAYMEQFSCDIIGLDPKVFEQTWNYLLRRHSVLRSAFYHDVFDIPVQCVYRDVEITVDITDHRLLNTEEKKAALKAYEDADLKTGFDFKAAPLMRLGLIRLSEDRYRMVWTSHHILFDGWSLALLMEEFLSTCEQAVSGEKLQGKKEDRYEDYIRYLERADYEPAEKYWRTYLQNIQQATLLPFINSTTERIKGIGEYQSVFLKIDAVTTILLQDYVQQHRVTVNTVMQGVWAYLLHSYTGNPDIVFGAIVSGRTNDIPDIENRVGMFINTLPLHAHLSAERAIADWLQQIQVEQVSSRQFQHLPLQDIQALTPVQGDLFDSLLVFENYPVGKILSSKEGTLQFENIQLRDQNNYPLTVTIGITEEVRIDFRYNTSLIQAAYIQKIKAHFEHVLLQIIQQEKVQLKDIELLTVQDKQQLLLEFNNTNVLNRIDKNIIELFEEQVIKNPGSTALVFEAKEISFSELNQRANQLAHYLSRTGTAKNKLVPVFLERSIEMVVAIWGILKAGRAYVPVDPAFPPERIRYILNDCCADMVISNEKSISLVEAIDAIRIIDLDDQSLFANMPTGNPNVKVEPDGLAYIMYTSGSTGHPKGVMVQHWNLVHYICNSKTEYIPSEMKGAGSFMHLSYTFDASLTALFMPLLKGKSIIIGSKDATDVFEDANLWKYAPYDFIKLTPAHLVLLQPKMVSPDGTLLTTTLVVGGEALYLSHVHDMLNKELSLTVINEYGPTEATIGCSTYAFNTAGKNEALQIGIPIGKPIDHTELYIVNEAHEMVAIGVAGEICIGGAGIAKGYLNRPDLTAEKFVTNPFKGNGSETIYKTGDIGRWLPDGNIEYLGRKDDQVKIRGYRIELGEIESVLQQSEWVKQAVVLAIGDTTENKRLVSYIIPEGYFEKEKMLDHLSSRLPGYMIPSLLMEMDTLPLTQNGKIDRKALAAIETEDNLTDQHVAARNETEERLTAIWQRLLETDHIGINDDFFESGGHSLLAVRMIAAIRKEFAAEPDINEIFDYPTIALMAARLQSLIHLQVQPVVSDIGVQTRPVHIPLSYSQERLWFIHQLEGSLQYHVPAVLGLHGKLNKQALSQSLQSIINRHEVLRTVIRQADGKGYQFVLEKGGWQLEVVEGGIFEEDNEALQGYINKIIKKPFDLSNDHLIRATLITLNDNEHKLVVTMHHIAADAWSTAILVKEFMKLYGAYSENRTAQLPPIQLQYADYAIWQRNFLRKDILHKKLDYWKQKLDDLLPLQLPADYGRPAESSTKGASAAFHISTELHNQLLQVSQQHGATLYMTLLAAFTVLLYRYSGQQDICVGTSIAGRPHQELEGLIGFFVNTLALRNEVKGDMPFSELLAAVRTTMLEAYAHQDVPFEKVVEAVVKDRDPGWSPLFQVMLVLGNTPVVPDLALGHLVVSHEPYEFTTVKFDLTFFLTETPKGLEGNVLYSTDLFKSDRIERMMEHFAMLLHSVVSAPENHVGTLTMLSVKEESGLKQGLGISKFSPRENNTVVTLFEKQAIRWPKSVAVNFEGTEVTYAELNVRANRLAHCLRKHGVKEDTLVPLFIDRGPDMITGIIGILKAGGAYVPVDTGLPPERIGFMLHDTAAPVVVCNSRSREKLSAYEIELVEIDGKVLIDQSIQNPDIIAVAHNLVYVIYTSGSTGQPKGVMVTHGNLTDYVQGLDECTGINSCQSFALVSTISTDLGNTVLFGSLISGGTLHIFSKEMVSNIEGLHDYFRKHYIDCVKIVPSHWKALMMDGAPLLPRRLLVFGGESLHAEQVAIIRENGRNCRVINHYGPTETTVGKLLYEVDIHQEYEGTIPIGNPFGDNRIYVLSTDRSLCPIGVPGQLYIGGAGVARGYLNNEELTSEKFIADPFDKSSRLVFYKTGDLVKYNAEGEIIFLGRIDDQVKIRGYRVEPGEVERVLSACELVKQAVVLAKEDSQGNKRLIGYIVADGYFDREGILAYLQQKLPDYMIPAILVPLETMPLTANGKIDRQALPDPDATAQSGIGYVAPRNEAERQLANIWEDVLEVEQVGVHDNFFELGGHSLLAVRLISAIRKGFNVEVSIGAVFDYPTVAELAAQLSLPTDKAAETLPAITAVNPRPVHIPLSFSQERLWFIHQIHGSVQYHVPAVLRLKGKLNANALSYALQEIINRQEVLRTVILDEQGQGYQYVKEKNLWHLTLVDGSMYKNDLFALQEFVHEILYAPFDLSKDDMIRGHLITIEDEEYLLVINLHHVASDGWSRSILVKELTALYESYENGASASLPELALQYVDYAIWQRRYLQGEAWNKKLTYWKKQLDGVASLQLPADFTRPAIQSTKGAFLKFEIDNEISKKMQSLSQLTGSTLFMTLLAAFKVLLHRYSGQQDICVGTPIAGRQQQELEGLIGFFVNTLALRNQLNDGDTFYEFLQQVKITTIEAFQNQELPFENVVDAVIKERDPSRNPLFQVMFALENTPQVPELRLGKTILIQEDSIHYTSRFDLTFTIKESETGLNGIVEYCTDLFSEQTVLRMIDHYQQLIGSIATNPDCKIASLSMMCPAEIHQLLVEFNNTRVAQPDKTITGLFEDQVLAVPDNIALVFDQQKMTYRDLNERANQVAHYLRKKGIKEETLVPIIMPPSIEMIVVVIGILKSGAAYVPIDPEHPYERIKYMLEDLGAGLVIINQKLRYRLPVENNFDIVEIESTWSALEKEPITNLRIGIQPNSLAYIIYTSGSTGRPKGVMIEHASLLNYLLNSKTDYLRNNSTLTGSFAHLSYTFDASLTGMFMPLLSGKQIIIASKNTDNVFEDNNLYKYAPVDFIKLTPAHLGLLVSAIKKADGSYLTGKLIVGGEALRLNHFKSFIDNEINIEVVNEYGPTEATIGCSTYCFNTSGDEEKIKNGISIGKAIDNVQLYILDKRAELVPIGIVGEIHIGGSGLARGYLNSPVLTAEKFISHPFSKDAGARIYKTGDLGRWLADGNIEYLGRKDEQVKIRGYRVELGEIENTLQQIKWLSQVVVLGKEDKEESKRLTCYYVPVLAAVKSKEQQLHFQRVADWKGLYETEYALTETDESNDPEFNIIGWNDSFTGQPIPTLQMKEWLGDIVDTILSEQPGHALEIGCGTGLIYYQLAGKVKKYMGTDLSISAVNQIKERINKQTRDYGPTELWTVAAHEVSLKKEENVDTVILNSIAQYFPGEDYMNEVIERSISLLNGKGRIIIGDIRDKRLLPAFKARLLLQKLRGNISIKELNWAVEQDVLKEEELCFAPEYFYDLQLLYPQITHIDIQWKKANYINELSLYRYTVVMYVGIEKEVIVPKWQNWNEGAVNQNVIHQFHVQLDIIAIKDVPNPRMWKERLLQYSLRDSALYTVEDIESALKFEDADSLLVKELFSIAAVNGYHYKLLLDEDPLLINVVFERQQSPHLIDNVYRENGVKPEGPKTNIPLFADISLLLQKEIKLLLLEKLPEYMVPTEWFALSKLPLTINGKLDRKFLSEREDKIFSNQLNYAPPRIEVEEKLVTIWEEFLHLERVGIYDNFFELGGHSLMAMRVISSIRTRLNLELAIKDLFLHPTIAQLSFHLQSLHKGAVLPAIEKQVRQLYSPLSFSQERLWFIDRLGGSIQYQMPTVLRLKGRLDDKLLEDVLLAIIQRQEILRTVIVEKNGQGYQKLLNAEGWELKKIAGSLYENEEELTHYIQTVIDQPIDLSKDYMLRAHLIALSELEHLLVITIHHIATDGWSASVLVHEVVEFYHAFIEKKSPKLPHLQLQYVDYAIWQRTWLQGELLERKLLYWKEKLTGVAPLQLPVDYPRPAVWSGRGSTVTFTINQKLTAALKAIGQQQESTLFMTLLAAFTVLLHRYSGQSDICVGTPIGNRPQQELERLIGFFVNTLALRNAVTADMPFIDLLKQVKNTTLDAYEHQEVPFEKVVDMVVKERDMSRNPVFQVLFSMQNTPEVPQLRLGELEVIREVPAHTTSRFDLTFTITETKEAGLEMNIEYNTDLYITGTITQMAEHYRTLLSAVVATPEKKIGLLPMMTNQEKQRLIVDFNTTKSDYPKNKTVTDLFAEQTIKTPEAIAVVYEQKQLTYSELNKRSNQLSHYLRSKGVKKETVVPLCLDRSLEMIIGILGILKAGGAYVPIDPQYPMERISYMMQDAGASLIISSHDIGPKLAGVANLVIIELDWDWETIANQPAHNLPQIAGNTNSLAYVMYTSGSTGRPKGVMIEHNALLNRLMWAQNYYGLTIKDSILQKTNFCFDVSVWELLWPLIAGARLVFAKPEGNKDNEYLKNIISDQKITLLHFVPSMLSVFLADVKQGECKGLKRVLCSGEALTPAQVALFRKKFSDTELSNLYGPTEAAIDVTCWLLPKNEETKVVLIGKPISNTSIYILDNSNQCVPIGVEGEIWIGGIQVARGYLNKVELTAERFVADTFSSYSGVRMYKTGDLGRWLPDGNIEYLGRKDEQVKIRGYRIELGEIESVLQQSGLVSQVVIVAKEDINSHKLLIGYVVAKGQFDKNKIISYLQSKLPEYMVPAIWVELENLPLTSNGKTDRKALPDASMNDQLSNQYIAPRDQMEVDLAEVWQDLLQIDKVGIHDNFFELGGDSIITIQVVSRLKDLGHAIQPRDIFIYQTISNLSSAVNSFTESFAEQDTLIGSVGLLPIQQWFFETEQTAISHFNQSVLLAIDKKITAAILTQAVEQIVHHHDALRFKYTHQEGRWQQEYGTALPAIITEDIGSEQIDALGTLIKQMADGHQRSLDIEKGDIMRVVWIQTPPEERSNRLLIIIHHLAVDGVSWRILLEDLERLLTASNNNDQEKTGPKTTSYRRWYQALENYGRSNHVLSQKGYWKKVVNSFQPVVVDNPYTGKVTAGETGEFAVKLRATQTHRLLQEIPRVYHTEINDLLLCALAKTLSEWCNRDEVVIGVEGHGREKIGDGIDISRTVGWFTTLYPLLLQTGEAKGLDDLIKTVKEQLRRVPDKGLGYGVLKYINKDETLQDRAPWDIQFNYMGQLDNVVRESKWLAIADEAPGRGRSEAYQVSDKLSINSHIKGGELVTQWSYSTQHYLEETIRNLAAGYLQQLDLLIEHCIQQGKTGVVYTPSDYGLGSDVSFRELDAFLEENNSDNIMSF